MHSRLELFCSLIFGSSFPSVELLNKCKSLTLITNVKVHEEKECMNQPKETTQNSLEICQVLTYSLHEQEGKGNSKE